jgi:hypothetical protein
VFNAHAIEQVIGDFLHRNAQWSVVQVHHDHQTGSLAVNMAAVLFDLY